MAKKNDEELTREARAWAEHIYYFEEIRQPQITYFTSLQVPS